MIGTRMTMMHHPIQNSAQILQPRPVRHWLNLVWWLLLVGVVFTAHELPQFISGASPPPYSMPSAVTGAENEAFVALVFGKISSTHELAISAASFESNLAALKQAGYSTVRLEQINRWRHSETAPLPAKPVLLTFEEANRETMDIADKVLAALGMTAVVFVDVDLLDQTDIHLVSWHQLELMAKSGRWEVGISGCPNADEQAFASPALLAERLTRQRERLEYRLDVPIVTADCSRAWNSHVGDGAAVWTQALNTAALQTGFVAAPPGANYRNDPESGFRRIRVSRTWDPTDMLAQIENHAPRRTNFIDKFQSDQSASAWVVDTGEIALEDGSLRLFNQIGEKGALITLGGTEKWRDADVQVQLKGLPEGQFWLSLRHQTGQPSVRLGVAEGRVVLQASDAVGRRHQLVSRRLASGAVTLRLRVVGSRAIAYLNGQPLLKRPIAMPKGADQGAFALAVWDKYGEAGSVEPGKAAVRLAQVSATPLFPKGGIVGSAQGNAAWEQLRRYAQELSMVSPSYFSWINGKPRTAEVDDRTIEFFARYHRLTFLPALFIDADTPLSDASALTEQALTWLRDPAYDGLNIVLNSTMAGNEWKAFLSELNRRMGKLDKTLAVTLLDSKERPMTAVKHDHVLLVAAHTDLLSVGPRLLYPLGKSPRE